MLIALTGAGISAPSGIPTFADQPVIRDKLTRSFAHLHPEEFHDLIAGLKTTCDAAKPNDAHIALAEYGVPIITMNVDGLHARAGSEHVLEIHGSIRAGNVVLYGDPAPLYQEADDWVWRLDAGDVLLVVGTSYYTNVSSRLRDTALDHHVTVIEINDDAETKVRQALEHYANAIEPLDGFLNRTQSLYTPMPSPYGGWDMP